MFTNRKFNFFRVLGLMKTCLKKTVCLAFFMFFILSIVGCEPAQAPMEIDAETQIDLGTTIGSLVEIFSVDAIHVEGYSIVGGLRGTGSSECPPEVRAYLKRYLLTQLPKQKISVEEFINSRNTAVVVIHGIMPAVISGEHGFDVMVRALNETQTTSLEGGWLYGADLRAIGSFGLGTKILAEAKGPVYIDTIGVDGGNKRIGYILGVGRVLDEYKISLSLRKPKYTIASRISNKLNERFGSGTANAVSVGQIELKVPVEYIEQKARFISLIKAMYLTETPAVVKERISKFVRGLAVSEDKYSNEIALEAIGNASLGKLGALLNSSNERVRLHTAKCMLNLGSDKGFGELRKIAADKQSPYRIEALEAIVIAAKRNDAASISRRLLLDEDFKIRLAAYEQLRKLDDIAIRQMFVGRKFYLEQITQTQYKTIYVARSGQPRIVLFGAPMRCRDNIFIQSPDGYITINAPSGQKYVSIIRKHPRRPNVIAKLKSSFELSDIIRTLCEEPLSKDEKGRAGLGVSYDDMIALLKQMSEKGAVVADFEAGTLPKISLIIKK